MPETAPAWVAARTCFCQSFGWTTTFEQLSAQQGQLEAVYERELSWEELPNKKASRVADYKDGCAVTAVERHDEFIDWFFDAGIRLRAALKTVSIA